MGQPQVVAGQRQRRWHLPPCRGRQSASCSPSLSASLFVLAALPSCFVWLAFGATVQRFLQTERAARGFNLVMAPLLAGSVVLFIR